MTLVRWEPFRNVLDIQNRLGRLMSELSSRWPDDEDAFGTWVPPVDIFERGEGLVVRAELPGVSKDDIEVRVENGTLVLRGERRTDRKLGEESAYKRERPYGTFTRSFGLPTTVDASQITATLKDGVEMVLPKTAEAKPKKIEIRAA